MPLVFHWSLLSKMKVEVRFDQLQLERFETENDSIKAMDSKRFAKSFRTFNLVSSHSFTFHSYTSSKVPFLFWRSSKNVHKSFFYSSVEAVLMKCYNLISPVIV